MKPQTVQLLNQLNTLFYQTVSKSFDKTRERPWSGWFDLLPYIHELKMNPLRVLDVGCGNGRFGLFLNQHRRVVDESINVDQPIQYFGIDSSAFLLERAAEDLSTQQIPHQLQKVDLLNDDYQPPQPADLVVLFGVMHHIPGFENRKKLIEQATNWTAPGGLLVITFWQFYDNERLRERVIAWDDPLVPEPYQNLQVEAHDYLLDWQRETYALRYCHHTDNAEIERLLSGMEIVTQFDADNSNRYVIIKKNLEDGDNQPS